MTNQTWWYVARSGGIVAWALLAFGVFWGVALSSKFLGKRPKPNWMLDLHRFLGGLSVVFVAVHVLALVGDSYVTITVVQILVPITGSYRPGAVAWGVVGLYLLLAVEITSLLRKRLGKRTWRAVHFLSFPMFVVSTVHLLLIGTDRTTRPLRVAVLLTVAALGISTLIRIFRADAAARPGKATPYDLIATPSE
jgi:DMSO/TMAO reductase YedYZ heme-binding membrane subunit